MSPDGRGPRACDAPGHPPFAPRRDRRPPDALLSPSPVLSAAGVKPLMPPSGSPVARVHVRVCVPLVAVCPMRAALLGVACLRVFVWPLSVSLVGFGVWYAVEVRSAGYRERCAGACRCVYYCLIDRVCQFRDDWTPSHLTGGESNLYKDIALKGVDLMLRNSSFTHRDRLSSSAGSSAWRTVT